MRVAGGAGAGETGDSRFSLATIFALMSAIFLAVMSACFSACRNHARPFCQFSKAILGWAW